MTRKQLHKLCSILLLYTTTLALYPLSKSNYCDIPDTLDAYADVSPEQEKQPFQRSSYSWHDKSLYYIRRVTCAYLLYELFYLYQEYTKPASYLSRFIPSLLKDTYTTYACSAQVLFIFGKAYVYHTIATSTVDTLLGNH